MKLKFSYFYTLILSALLLSCTKYSSQRNPYLQEVSFQIGLDVNLPAYSDLLYEGMPIYISDTGVGTKGIYVMNVGFDQIRAFEASCPNHSPSSCSTIVANGQVGTCNCESYRYSLFTGQLLNNPDEAADYYDLLEYNTRITGSVITVYN